MNGSFQRLPVARMPPPFRQKDTSRASERSHAAMVPRRDALLGSTFETRKISSRRSATASATTSSASPYISAVSMWVMPRSMPRRNAARAVLRSPRSIYQVPCPITDTRGPLLPNFRCIKFTSHFHIPVIASEANHSAANWIASSLVLLAMAVRDRRYPLIARCRSPTPSRRDGRGSCRRSRHWCSLVRRRI